MMNLMTGHVGGVMVHTTHNRGATPEELAERAVNRIISVGRKSHPEIVVQALAFREEVHAAVLFYLREAVSSHNTTLAHRFEEAGHPELVKLLRI